MSRQDNIPNDPYYPEHPMAAKQPPLDGPTRYRKAKRDRAIPLVAGDFQKGDKIVLEAKEGDGFQAFLLADVVDSYEFKPLSSWTNKFHLIVMVIKANVPRYKGVEGHHLPVSTETSPTWGARLVVSKMTPAEFVERWWPGAQRT